MRAEVENAVSLLQSGQPGALEQALTLLQDTVFSFSMKVCGQREDAEDTMQDVLLKSVPYLPKFDSPKALAVWLYTVAKNRCLMSRRKSKFAPREELSLEELMPDAAELDHLAAMASGEASPESALLESERGELLRQAILKLPPEYRLILVLHDMEELSTQEIARITRLKEGNVRVRLHRARLFVRKELAEAEAKAGVTTTKPAPRRRPKARAGADGRRTGAEAAHRPGACKQMFAQLSDYLDGALDDSMCEELERHMDDCKPCQAFLATLKNTVEQTRKLETVRPDPRTASEIRRRILGEFQKALAGK
ncbi:MAG: sigma-70 family RNA polymerase sigma factor [Terriglobales bacterium]